VITEYLSWVAIVLRAVELNGKSRNFTCPLLLCSCYNEVKMSLESIGILIITKPAILYGERIGYAYLWTNSRPPYRFYLPQGTVSGFFIFVL